MWDALAPRGGMDTLVSYTHNTISQLSTTTTDIAEDGVMLLPIVVTGVVVVVTMPGMGNGMLNRHGMFWKMFYGPTNSGVSIAISMQLKPMTVSIN